MSSSNDLVVIKFGGSALEIPQAAADFAKNVVALQQSGYRPVIVHGGGKSLSKWMEKVSLAPKFVEGLRFTDEPTLELAQMVLSGKANKDLVSLFNQAGGKAVGLSGSDGGLFIPHRVSSPSGADLGFVGEIAAINTSLLDTLLAKNFIPVVCSVAHDAQGQAFNINADHVAAELAHALRVEHLVLLTDVDGLMIDGIMQRRITAGRARDLLTHPSVTGGMRPKIEYALRALSGGAAQAHITNAAASAELAAILSGKSAHGTVISA